MKLDNEIKLDFNDVLIRPKRSELSSRSEVDMNTYFKFKYSSQNGNLSIKNSYQSLQQPNWRHAAGRGRGVITYFSSKFRRYLKK